METENEKVWVNTLMEKDLADKLDEMVAENGSSRAQLVRLLILNEYANRKQVKKLLERARKAEAR